MESSEVQPPVDIPATDTTKGAIRDQVFKLVRGGVAYHGQFPGEAVVGYSRKDGGGVNLDVKTKWDGEARGDLSQPVPIDQIDLTKPVTITFIEPKRGIKSEGIESLLNLVPSNEGEEGPVTLNETQVPDSYKPDPSTTASVNETRANQILSTLDTIVIEE